MNDMLGKGQFSLGENEAKLMRALIYAMVRSGGTECTLDEIKGAIPMNDLPDIFIVVYEIFSGQTFQNSDMEKLKQEKKVKNILTKNEESQSELDWDFYFYVGNTLLGLSMDDFGKSHRHIF
ncbi:hypothetical protein bthur0004_57670 [Bacillus thuringiensis serovar sotto str. T04001]|nr:hypothetical protein bthur0004_57670 [Bacillus thuringiensis serovar sotto str. T04001]